MLNVNPANPMASNAAVASQIHQEDSVGMRNNFIVSKGYDSTERLLCRGGPAAGEEEFFSIFAAHPAQLNHGALIAGSGGGRAHDSNMPGRRPTFRFCSGKAGLPGKCGGNIILNWFGIHRSPSDSNPVRQAGDVSGKQRGWE
jgi:hypothetical protein